jgi:hypothetical protein
MRAIFLAFVLSLSAAAAYAISACTQPSPSNTSINYFGFGSQCAQNNSVLCTTNETMVFSVVPNGYSFGCEAHTYFWDFGDGVPGSGINVFHTYASPGTYVVTMTLSSPFTSTTLARTITVITAFTPVPAIDRRLLIVLALAMVAIAFLRLR